MQKDPLPSLHLLLSHVCSMEYSKRYILILKSPLLAEKFIVEVISFPCSVSQTIQTKVSPCSRNADFLHSLSSVDAQARRKHFGSGAAIGTKKTAGGLGGAVSPPAGPGQSPGGGPGGEAPRSSVNLGILKP